MGDQRDIEIRLSRVERELNQVKYELGKIDHCQGCPVREEFDQITTKETLQPQQVTVSNRRDLTPQEVMAIIIVGIGFALIALFFHVVII